MRIAQRSQGVVHDCMRVQCLHLSVAMLVDGNFGGNLTEEFRFRKDVKNVKKAVPD